LLALHEEAAGARAHGVRSAEGGVTSEVHIVVHITARKPLDPPISDEDAVAAVRRAFDSRHLYPRLHVSALSVALVPPETESA
jgi:hypothetical protein